MPKGIPWTKQEVDVLIALRTEGAKVAEIAEKMGKSEQAIVKKIDRLGLKVVHHAETGETTTSELIIPKELPTIEEALEKLAAAMIALEKPGLRQAEIMRLKALIHATNLYKQFFADYVRYRKIEAELLTLTEKYEEMAKRRSRLRR